MSCLSVARDYHRHRFFPVEASVSEVVAISSDLHVLAMIYVFPGPQCIIMVYIYILLQLLYVIVILSIVPVVKLVANPLRAAVTKSQRAVWEEAACNS